jgi:hypothetical protein
VNVNPTYLLIEIGATAFFVIAAWLALRRGRLPFLELVSAGIFGLLLEQANQVIFETYEYSPEFALAIDRAPIVIGLTWALIIAGAMRITDALGVRGRYAPVVDSVLAIMLDLAFDAVAIRMGLWTWRDIGPEQGWFGVPAGNFYAWLFVTLGFSIFTRWLRELSHRRRRSSGCSCSCRCPRSACSSRASGSSPSSSRWSIPIRAAGCSLFWVALALFVAVSAWAIWGPDRGRPTARARRSSTCAWPSPRGWRSTSSSSPRSSGSAWRSARRSCSVALARRSSRCWPAEWRARDATRARPERTAHPWCARVGAWRTHPSRSTSTRASSISATSSASRA